MTPAGDGWTPYERILRTGGPLGRALAEAGRAVRTSSGLEPAVARVATGVAAPVALGFAAWARARATARGATRLCFLARNACLPHDAAVASGGGGAVEVDYLVASRDLVRLASLAVVGPERWFEAGTATASSFLRQHLSGEDPATVVRRVGLDPLGDRALLDGAGWDPERLAGPGGADRFLAQARRPPLVDAIAARAADQLDLAHRYFEDAGLADRDGRGEAVALADIGWQGQQAAMLDAVLSGIRDRPVHHLHLGGYRPQEPVVPVSIERWLFEGAAPAWLGSPVPLFETLLPSVGAGAAGFERQPDGRVTVRYHPAAESNGVMDEALRRITREVAARVAEALDDGAVGHVVRGGPESEVDAATADLGPVVLEVCRRFWLHPDPAEARAWGARAFERDGSGRLVAPLARPITAADLVAAARGRPLGRVWPEGAVAASGAPIRLALGALRRRHRSAGDAQPVRAARRKTPARG